MAASGESKDSPILYLRLIAWYSPYNRKEVTNKTRRPADSWRPFSMTKNFEKANFRIILFTRISSGAKWKSRQPIEGASRRPDCNDPWQVRCSGSRGSWFKRDRNNLDVLLNRGDQVGEVDHGSTNRSLGGRSYLTHEISPNPPSLNLLTPDP